MKTNINTILSQIRGSFQVYPYHLVEPSPWTLLALLVCLILTLGGVIENHNVIEDYYYLSSPFLLSHTFNISRLGGIKPAFHFRDFNNLIAICRQLKGIAGIYLWHNRVTGEIYVGSAIDLKTRLLNYGQKSTLSSTTESRIINSLNKYPLNCWELIIIEVTDLSNSSKVDYDNLISKETYWINFLDTELNINRSGSSRVGHSPSEATRAKMSAAQKGRNFSDEHKAKLSEAKQGENHPFFGKTLSNEAKAKIGAKIAIRNAKKLINLIRRVEILLLFITVRKKLLLPIIFLKAH